VPDAASGRCVAATRFVVVPVVTAGAPVAAVGCRRTVSAVTVEPDTASKAAKRLLAVVLFLRSR
jgi:hypothetical protein